MATNRSWHLVKRPQGTLGNEHFELRESPAPEPADGQVRIRNLYLSLDPTNRIWTREKDSYMPSVPLGGVMRGLTIGRIDKSRNPALPEGTIVSALGGWEDYSISDGSLLWKIDQPKGIPLSARFALYEHIGTPAYFGLTRVGQLKKGDTVVVSAAAGAAGSLALQMARNLGAGRVVGLAGSASKCKWLTDELGADVAINYKTDDIPKALAAACPNGIDVYFDNTGGPILEAVLDLINMKARIAICGNISSYDADCDQPGPRNLFNLLFKRARMEGFVCFDFAADTAAWAECDAAITRWHLDGKLKYRLDLQQGLENAPTAIGRLFNGTNTGKLVVQIAAE
jgi:NADPH-dependent curcumin reductase CurA